MPTYKDSFNDVLKYIHFHLDEKLDLEKLAKIAFVSKFHFHRLFKSFLNESLGSYVNRMRVETGAKLLKYSDLSISEIAYKVGYETPTSFNKSFKKIFEVSPGTFRKEPNHSFESIKNTSSEMEFNLVMKEEVISDILILCNQSKGSLQYEERETKWVELMGYAHQNNLLKPNTKLIGIVWDDPSITDVDKLRSDACFSLEAPIKNAPFPIKKIEGGKYLCFTYKGDYKYMGNVYDQIFKNYILNKEIKLREQPLFDQYLNDVNNTPTSELLTKIYIPIF